MKIFFDSFILSGLEKTFSQYRRDVTPPLQFTYLLSYYHYFQTDKYIYLAKK